MRTVRACVVVLLALGAIAARGTAAADAPPPLPASVAMSYGDCLREIGATAGRLGQVPEVVEDRPGLHVVRFTTPTGRIVLGCSADAGYLAVATGG
jgi:hypothetical protein